MSYLRPRDALRGVTPTQDTWTTAPTSLGNCTDGDPSTVTGTGSKTLIAAGNYGILYFDMGVAKTVIVGAKLGLWSTDNSVYVKIEQSEDGISYPNTAVDVVGVLSTTEVVINTIAVLVTTRYFRLRFYLAGSDGSTGCNAKIYEVVATEMSLEK